MRGDDLFIELAAQAGYKPNPISAVPPSWEWAATKSPSTTGMRWSAADGYLRPALERPNLTG